MTRHAWTRVGAAALVMLAAAGTADAKQNRFGNRVHAALAQNGVTSAEIADGTIACEDLSSEVLNGCSAADTGGQTDAGAQNVFMDGFTQVNRDMPSTSSANDPAASIAKLTVGEGSHIILASIVWSANPLDFSGIVSCHLVPPNGPNSKAEFIGQGTTTGTLFIQTTNVGPGVVDFRCSDQSAGSTVQYRFLQLTAIPVSSITRTQLPDDLH